MKTSFLPFDRTLDEIKDFFGRDDPEMDACVEALAPYLEPLYVGSPYGRSQSKLQAEVAHEVVGHVNESLARRPIAEVRFHLKTATAAPKVCDVDLPPTEILAIGHHYLKSAAFSLLFLRNLQRRTDVVIGREEAVVLLACVHLEEAMGVIDRNYLGQYLREEPTLISLDTLLQNLVGLGCVTLRQGEVILNDTVKISSLDERSGDA